MSALDTHSFSPRRPLSRVLLRITLLLALSLGTIAAVVQLWIDLQQEKDAVQVSAEEFLASVAPSAASAAYNFYDQAAIQVAEGLFTQRAITAVKIINDGSVMIDRSREVASTLPSFGSITDSDEVVLSRDLIAPPETGLSEVIGSISVTVDRAAVPPAIVNRMFSYFLLATFKNFLLGVLLIAIVYGALTRYVINLSEIARQWKPGSGPIDIPRPPKFLNGTELELLGNRIGLLADTAMGEIRQIEASREAIKQSNSELSERSQSLSQAVQERTAELQEANVRLMHLAERDELTGLRNRRSFDKLAAETFAAAKKAGHSVSVLLIDVDHFKSYNDHYGHPAGDAALSRVGSVLLRLGEETGCLVARYGGEEFIALTGNDLVLSANELAEHIHKAIEDEDIEHQRSTISNQLTVSIGSASSLTEPGRGDLTMSSLLSAADEALYEAKRNGRNRTERSTSQIRARIREQRLAARSLLEGIEAEHFEPFFQPQFDVRTGAIIGSEALVRWRYDDDTVISPAEFMEPAIESGLIKYIDQIVIRKSGEFLRELTNYGLVLPRLSLNAPRDGIYEDSFINSIIELADSTSTQIAVELLETAVIDSPDDMFVWQIERLKEAGVEIEIDDFGTGHTSILGLKTINPQRLKIAKELIIPLTEDAAHEKIVKSVIEIGRALEVDVLAEGVETKSVSQMLRKMGCPLQQGFCLGYPAPAQQFKDTLFDASQINLHRKSA